MPCEGIEVSGYPGEGNIPPSKVHHKSPHQCLEDFKGRAFLHLWTRNDLMAEMHHQCKVTR